MQFSFVFLLDEKNTPNLLLLFAVSAFAQNTIEAEELPKKEIRKLIKAEVIYSTWVCNVRLNPKIISQLSKRNRGVKIKYGGYT
jgi:hypothetical protein